jgi:hypothetical protein
LEKQLGKKGKFKIEKDFLSHGGTLNQSKQETKPF